VLLAKNSHIHSVLQQTNLCKVYRALVFGSPTEDSGIIDAPIARRELPSLLRYVSPEGKPSVTEYTVLERGKTCKVALKPITGRTHQLRLHCCHMGFPILGDPQYYSQASKEFSDALGLTYQQLCAYSLEFVHPITGESLFITTKMDIK
jgi:23S rRNA-/tRNA-specific pseudouridylate synthase